MICSISGEAAGEPVVSIKSGHVFEKRLILKYLENNNGLCPITHEPLSPQDLVSVKESHTVKPRPATATSIPGMLQLFQNEWDALMLETFSLKQQLDNVRQDLAHALYQHDAACRVIARLIKERDEARTNLANFQVNPPVVAPGESSSSTSDAMQVDSASKGTTESISDTIKEKITSKAQELSKERKKRTVSPDVASAEAIASYQVLSSHNYHKSTEPGVLSVDICARNQDLIVTGGVDKAVSLFNRGTKQIVHTYREHRKKVTQVMFHPTEAMFFSTSADSSAKIWKESEEESQSTVKIHENEVVGCSIHPTGDYWCTASSDQSWAFLDVRQGECISKIKTDTALECISFHPDGLILGTGGVDSTVKIWDLKAMKNVASFEGHKGKIVDLSFSENGYFLSTVAEDDIVKLWDLRKLKNIYSFNLPEDFSVTTAVWDYSGTYLAVAGRDIRVLYGKTLTETAVLKKHTATVCDVKWGNDAKFLVSVSMDRSTKFWGKKTGTE
jgi:pre-mRNA-processing factor 19